MLYYKGNANKIGNSHQAYAEKIISKAIKPDNIETLDTQKLTIRINRQLAARGYDEDTIQSAIYQACTNLITDIH